MYWEFFVTALQGDAGAHMETHLSPPISGSPQAGLQCSSCMSPRLASFLGECAQGSLGLGHCRRTSPSCTGWSLLVSDEINTAQPRGVVRRELSSSRLPLLASHKFLPEPRSTCSTSLVATGSNVHGLCQWSDSIFSAFINCVL